MTDLIFSFFSLFAWTYFLRCSFKIVLTEMYLQTTITKIDYQELVTLLHRMHLYTWRKLQWIYQSGSKLYIFLSTKTDYLYCNGIWIYTEYGHTVCLINIQGNHCWFKLKYNNKQHSKVKIIFSFFLFTLDQ